MQGDYLKESESFFRFLLDSNTTKQQKEFLLLNLSQKQQQAIIEIIHNFLKNNYIKITPTLKKAIKQHHHLLIKFISPKSLSLQYKLIHKHFKVIYLILSKGKDTILSVLSK